MSGTNTKLSADKLFTGICIVTLCLIQPNAWAQKNMEPGTAELQKEFGDDAKIVCLNSSTSYTFEYTSSRNAMSPANATEAIDEEMKSMKDDYNFVCRFYYNDFTDVGKIRTFDKKDKRIDAYIYDLPVESSSEFSSGERVRAFTLNFENRGDKGGYTGERYYGDLRYLCSAYFRADYPIVDKEIVFTIPKWMNVELKEMNFDGYDIKKAVTTDAKGNTVYTYTAHNLKEVDGNESSVPGWSYMYPHILIMCKSFTSPDGKTTNIISSVGDMYSWYKKLVAEAGNNDETLKPIVNNLIKNKTTDIDKVKALYYWVQDNIRYLAFENGIAGNKPDACQDVLQKKYGDCKGMANLLAEMLKLAGFDARRTWLGTRSIAYDYSTPCLAVNNHCICTLVLAGKHYYLDCTESYASFNDNADRIQGRQVLIEDGDKYMLETIPVAPIERSKVVIDKTMTLGANDILSGNAHYVYNGESKTRILQIYHEIPSDKKQDALNILAEGNDANLSASSVNTTDLEDREVPLKMSYDFKMKNQVSDFDNDTYVNMDYDKVFQNMTFDSTRQCDYQFNFRYDDVINDTLVVPSGYTVKHLPDNVDKVTPNYVFKVNYTQAGNKILYHTEVQILNEIIRKKDFPAWNADLAVLKKTYDDQVVLTKGK